MFGKDRVVPLDPWKGSGDSYVSRYRQKLDRAAEALAYPLWQGVYTEYDVDGRCAVIRTKTEIIARVRVNGEVGSAYEAIVRTDLDDYYHALFQEALKGVRVRFETLRPYLAR